MRLGEVISGWRFANHVGVREAAKAIGLSSATLSRIENNGEPDGQSLAKILRWLMADGETRRAK